jgi:nucleoside-diphosphate-sugar epimerase
MVRPRAEVALSTLDGMEGRAKRTGGSADLSPNCSIAKAERMLGYRPRYQSIEAVCESVNWLIEKEIVQVNRKAV